MALAILRFPESYPKVEAPGVLTLAMVGHLYRDDWSEVEGYGGFQVFAPTSATPAHLSRAIVDGAVADAADRGVSLDRSDVLLVELDRG